MFCHKRKLRYATQKNVPTNMNDAPSTGLQIKSRWNKAIIICNIQVLRQWGALNPKIKSMENKAIIICKFHGLRQGVLSPKIKSFVKQGNNNLQYQWS